MPSQFSYSSARLCRVQKLQFGILSPDEVVSPIFALSSHSRTPRCSDSPLPVLRGRMTTSAPFSVVEKYLAATHIEPGALFRALSRSLGIIMSYEYIFIALVSRLYTPISNSLKARGARKDAAESHTRRTSEWSSNN